MTNLRARVRKMTDVELLAFGKLTRYICTPARESRQAAREPFVIQLREARRARIRAAKLEYPACLPRQSSATLDGL